eukprot:5241158-Pyramimonas_sp.AAC.1
MDLERGRQIHGSLNPKKQATGSATSVTRGAWPNAQRAWPYSVRRTDEARSVEEEFARRACTALLVQSNGGNT